MKQGLKFLNRVLVMLSLHQTNSYTTSQNQLVFTSNVCFIAVKAYYLRVPLLMQRNFVVSKLKLVLLIQSHRLEARQQKASLLAG